MCVCVYGGGIIKEEAAANVLQSGRKVQTRSNRLRCLPWQANDVTLVEFAYFLIQKSDDVTVCQHLVGA